MQGDVPFRDLSRIETDRQQGQHGALVGEIDAVQLGAEHALEAHLPVDHGEPDDGAYSVLPVLPPGHELSGPVPGQKILDLRLRASDGDRRLSCVPHRFTLHCGALFFPNSSESDSPRTVAQFSFCGQ